jgi:hypothetical protein
MVLITVCESLFVTRFSFSLLFFLLASEIETHIKTRMSHIVCYLA